MKNYVPEPLDTSEVIISDELKALAEAMAKNTHEVWAVGKMAEGWVYGERLDAEKKTHPSLIEYEALSESQKDYDRRTSIETLKFVLATGFDVVKSKNRFLQE